MDIHSKLLVYLIHHQGCKVYRIQVEDVPMGQLFAIYPLCDCGLKEAIEEELPELGKSVVKEGAKYTLNPPFTTI